MHDLTPRQIVAELDRHIIGQHAAKRAVAIAVRNRWRRRQLDADLAREVMPKNIIMIGPTGVGKTEIARRLAGLTGAPFIKVEASKYTEVGYHGRDVESMIRDLLERAISIVREEHATAVRKQADEAVEKRLVSLLMGDEETPRRAARRSRATVGAVRGAEGDTVDQHRNEDAEEAEAAAEREHAAHEAARARMAERLRDGYFDDREIELNITERQSIPVIGMMGPDQLDPAMTSMLEQMMPEQRKRRRVTVKRARSILLEEETEKLIDREKIIEQAIDRTQQQGIIFLDEIDKIATTSEGKSSGSADVSRQGVQRDLLPIVEGSAVTTRHGIVHSDGILFIAAGAFHSTSVSDLMPELQGRFPIRVELEPLTKEDFARILVEPDSALTKQQSALLGAEGLEVSFEPDAIDALAEIAAEANARLENIGARRLVTVLERTFEEISFDAPERAQRGEKKVVITAEFVRERLRDVLDDRDLRQFVL